MRTHILPTCVCAAVMVIAASAHADGITANVDRTEISLQDTLQLTITVNGSKSAQPTLPSMPQFEVQGRGQSTQVHIINGSMSTAGTYAFELFPRQAGAFVIGPTTVTIDGKTYESEPFTVRVSAQAAEPQEQGNLFVSSDVSSHDPVLGQQIVYTWRFYRKVRIGNASIGTPSFEGFWTQELGGQRDYQTSVRGQQYLVTEIRKALFPQEVGAFTLPPVSLDCEVIQSRGGRGFDDGFGNSPFDEMFGRVQRQHKTLRTNPVEINVHPLPQPVPPGFDGLVGQFQIHADVSQSQLRTGESATLTITVSGLGNAQNINEPSLGDLSGFKVYDDKPVISVNNKGDQLAGSKVFKKALVPTKAGELVVPALSVVYFDPDSKSYQTRSTPPFTLHVAQGENQVQVTPQLPPSAFQPLPNKTDVKLLADDLLPLYKHADTLRSPETRRNEQAAWGVLFVAPPCIAALFALWQRRRDALRDPMARRRRDALARGIRATGEVRDLVAKGQVAPAAVRASRGVREYLGDKLGLEGLALTPNEAREHLQAKGVATDLAHQVQTVLQRCEAAQYGASAQGPEGFSALPAELKKLLNQLDRTLRA